jgi:hypothetical protein
VNPELDDTAASQPVPAPAADISSYRMETIREGRPVGMESPADITGIQMETIRTPSLWAASCWSILFAAAASAAVGFVIGFVVALW